MGLFNVKMQDEAFYNAAKEDSVIVIDKDNKTIQIEGVGQVFHYYQSEIEQTLLDAGGVLPLYSQFGTDVFHKITAPKVKRGKKRKGLDVVPNGIEEGGCGSAGAEVLAW